MNVNKLTNKELKELEGKLMLNDSLNGELSIKEKELLIQVIRELDKRNV